MTPTRAHCEPLPTAYHNICIPPITNGKLKLCSTGWCWWASLRGPSYTSYNRSTLARVLGMTGKTNLHVITALQTGLGSDREWEDFEDGQALRVCWILGPNLNHTYVAAPCYHRGNSPFGWRGCDSTKVLFSESRKSLEALFVPLLISFITSAEYVLDPGSFVLSVHNTVATQSIRDEVTRV